MDLEYSEILSMELNWPSYRNMEDFVAKGDMNYDRLALKISEEKNFNMWLKDCFYDILVKNKASFCPCLKSLPEAKVRGFIFLS